MDYNAELQHQNESLKREIELLKSERKRIKQTRVKLSLLLLALLLFSLVSTTFAWFTISSISSVNNMEITIGTGVQLLISDQEHGNDLNLYTNEVTNEAIDRQLSSYNTSLSHMQLDPLTSSDGVNLYTQRGVRKDANNESFLEFDLFFIATEDMWVHLTSDESEAGADNGTKISTSSTGMQADIINCTRISFTDEAAGTSVIYEPNKGSAVGGQSTFDLPTPMGFSNSTRLFSLQALEPKMITVRVWIEGEDPQCDDDVQLANLQVRLNFEGTDDNNIPVN